MKIVFFDGYCSLCNSVVDWLINIDTAGEIKFASLQGETALHMLKGQAHSEGRDTIIYLRDEKIYERSTAILLILADIGGVGRVGKLVLIVPLFLRDFVYRWVAKYRYALFGRRDTCRLPTAQEKDRLLP